MVEAAVKVAAITVMTVVVLAEVKTAFSSKPPPQLPGAKHPTPKPAKMLTLPMQART